ncbi:MAG: ABC transporter ATP-binding protein [Candidatus Saganbacteria bacterium]|nr:ABC transporter ATP-binding protein [Candidatus Saganbacteria bacterium]
MNDEIVVKIKELTKTYKISRVEIPALRGVSFDVKRGEFVSIMGPSGCGKSTLMHLIGCLDHPTSGSVFIDSLEVSKLQDRELASVRNKRVGFVFQAYNLLPRLNALENIEIPLIYSGFRLKEREIISKKILSSIGLLDRARHRPTEMSGGEQQRVAIARALVNSPSIILADEPTGNLDSKTGDEIMMVFRKINEGGATIIMVTHEMDIARHTKRIIRLKDGQVISDEPIKQMIL